MEVQAYSAPDQPRSQGFSLLVGGGRERREIIPVLLMTSWNGKRFTACHFALPWTQDRVNFSINYLTGVLSRYLTGYVIATIFSSMSYQIFCAMLLRWRGFAACCSANKPECHNRKSTWTNNKPQTLCNKADMMSIIPTWKTENIQ